MSTISLKCKSCGGALDIDEDREILCCPFCGSKEIFEESDEVKKARIKSKAYRDVALGSKEIERQMKLDAQEAKVKNEKRKSKEFMMIFFGSIALLLLLIIVISLIP